jgi:tetratricopeptide (TPR) repeat protein
MGALPAAEPCTQPWAIPETRGAGVEEQLLEASLTETYAADESSTPAETVTSARKTLRLLDTARAGRMAVHDWRLRAHLTGIAAKQLLALGSPAKAQHYQNEAWEAVTRAVGLETGQPWKRGADLPAGLSEPTMGMLLRTVRYDAELLECEGRNVEAVERLQKIATDVTRLGLDGSSYRTQLLNTLASQQKFLGFWNDTKATLETIRQLTSPSDISFQSARFNLAYWRSQIEGPEPDFLTEARDASRRLDVHTQDSNHAQLIQRRLLAKMAFAYREADFDIGDLAGLVQEAEASGQPLEAFFARRDLGVIQRESKDFPAAETTLLATLGQVRAAGRKGSEPTIYREYGVLLKDTGRPREAIRMFGEAIRLSKSFRWTQHLPPLLHLLALAQNDAGDIQGLRATLAELQALLATGKLQPIRRLMAGEAIAVCLQALGQPGEATAALAKAVAAARQENVPPWQITDAQQLSLTAIIPAKPKPEAAKVDLQPVRIHSSVQPADEARARFTLSNPSAASISGTLVLEGPLTAQWNDAAATALLTLVQQGKPEIQRHPLTLMGGEEFLLTARGPAGATGAIRLRWEPAEGPPQPTEWIVSRTAPDHVDVAVTNASLAGRNAFYALRLHHALNRRSGDPALPVDLRVIASHPVRIELLTADTGELLAVDANGNGSLEDPGDLIIADANHDGAVDLPCPTGSPAEVALLIYPLTAAEQQPAASSSRKPLTLDIQLPGPRGWETAAQDHIK